MTVAQPASARADIVATIGNRIKEIVKKNALATAVYIDRTSDRSTSA
jgi:hypothetical protein